jgi:hypothetical protein
VNCGEQGHESYCLPTIMLGVRRNRKTDQFRGQIVSTWTKVVVVDGRQNDDECSSWDDWL